MKLPNGFGSVHKLTGNRRKPWRARKTVGWDFDPVEKKAKQKYITIGYYTTQKDAIQALADYNANPYIFFLVSMFLYNLCTNYTSFLPRICVVFFIKRIDYHAVSWYYNYRKKHKT